MRGLRSETGVWGGRRGVSGVEEAGGDEAWKRQCKLTHAYISYYSLLWGFGPLGDRLFSVLVIMALCLWVAGLTRTFSCVIFGGKKRVGLIESLEEKGVLMVW